MASDDPGDADRGLKALLELEQQYASRLQYLAKEFQDRLLVVHSVVFSKLLSAIKSAVSHANSFATTLLDASLTSLDAANTLGHVLAPTNLGPYRHALFVFAERYVSGLYAIASLPSELLGDVGKDEDESGHQLHGHPLMFVLLNEPVVHLANQHRVLSSVVSKLPSSHPSLPTLRSALTSLGDADMRLQSLVAADRMAALQSRLHLSGPEKAILSQGFIVDEDEFRIEGHLIGSHEAAVNVRLLACTSGYVIAPSTLPASTGPALHSVVLPIASTKAKVDHHSNLIVFTARLGHSTVVVRATPAKGTRLKAWESLLPQLAFGSFRQRAAQERSARRVHVISKSLVAMETNEWNEYPAKRLYPVGYSVAEELGPSELLDSAPFASVTDLNSMWIRVMSAICKSTVVLEADIFKKKEKGLRRPYQQFFVELWVNVEEGMQLSAKMEHYESKRVRMLGAAPVRSVLLERVKSVSYPPSAKSRFEVVFNDSSIKYDTKSVGVAQEWVLALQCLLEIQKRLTQAVRLVDTDLYSMEASSSNSAAGVQLFTDTEVDVRGSSRPSSFRDSTSPSLLGHPAARRAVQSMAPARRGTTLQALGFNVPRSVKAGLGILGGPEDEFAPARSRGESLGSVSHTSTLSDDKAHSDSEGETDGSLGSAAGSRRPSGAPHGAEGGDSWADEASDSEPESDEGSGPSAATTDRDTEGPSDDADARIVDDGSASLPSVGSPPPASRRSLNPAFPLLPGSSSISGQEAAAADGSGSDARSVGSATNVNDPLHDVVPERPGAGSHLGPGSGAPSPAGSPPRAPARAMRSPPRRQSQSELASMQARILGKRLGLSGVSVKVPEAAGAHSSEPSPTIASKAARRASLIPPFQQPVPLSSETASSQANALLDGGTDLVMPSFRSPRHSSSVGTSRLATEASTTTESLWHLDMSSLKRQSLHLMSANPGTGRPSSPFLSHSSSPSSEISRPFAALANTLSVDLQDVRSAVVGAWAEVEHLLKNQSNKWADHSVVQFQELVASANKQVDGLDARLEQLSTEEAGSLETSLEASTSVLREASNSFRILQTDSLVSFKKALVAAKDGLATDLKPKSEEASRIRKEKAETQRTFQDTSRAVATLLATQSADMESFERQSTALSKSLSDSKASKSSQLSEQIVADERAIRRRAEQIISKISRETDEEVARIRRQAGQVSQEHASKVWNRLELGARSVLDTMRAKSKEHLQLVASLNDRILALQVDIDRLRRTKQECHLLSQLKQTTRVLWKAHETTQESKAKFLLDCLSSAPFSLRLYDKLLELKRRLESAGSVENRPWLADGSSQPPEVRTVQDSTDAVLSATVPSTRPPSAPKLPRYGARYPLAPPPPPPPPPPPIPPSCLSEPSRPAVTASLVGTRELSPSGSSSLGQGSRYPMLDPEWQVADASTPEARNGNSGTQATDPTAAAPLKMLPQRWFPSSSVRTLIRRTGSPGQRVSLHSAKLQIAMMSPVCDGLPIEGSVNLTEQSNE